MPNSLYQEPASSTLVLPSPQDLKKILPLSFEQNAFIIKSRQKAEALLAKKEKKIVIIAGPCSIHEPKTALEYARRYKNLAKRVSDYCHLIMRVYIEKPRTTVGWKGFLYDPHLDGSHDIESGLYHSRKLLIELAEMEIPVATEFVDPIAAAYIEDLITWGFIGARTSASQTHRQLASSLNFPIGFKNGVDGNLDNAINGVIAAAAPHSYLAINQMGQASIAHSEGNPRGLVVLRGSDQKSNYDPSSVNKVIKRLKRKGILAPLLIDCAHGNCQKDYAKQQESFQSVIAQIAEGNEHILGVMLESHLEAGTQTIDFPLQPNISVTDPCIDWGTTEKLVLWANSLVQSSR